MSAEADEEECIGATVELPNGTTRRHQLPITDKDGDDVNIGDIKSLILAPSFNPEHFTLVFEKEGSDGGRLIADDRDSLTSTSYIDALIKHKCVIKFEARI
ncbi:hypothetical protein BgiMline_031772 [Biomphalaria glabrata]